MFTHTSFEIKIVKQYIECIAYCKMPLLNEKKTEKNDGSRRVRMRHTSTKKSGQENPYMKVVTEALGKQVEISGKKDTIFQPGQRDVILELLSGLGVGCAFKPTTKTHKLG